MKMVSDHDWASLRTYRGNTTKKRGKAEVLRCPVCGERMPYGALDHEKRKHVDLYARKAARRGELV
jgi:ribosomal protein S26